MPTRLIERLSSSDILVGCRPILPGDETALLDEEARSISARAVGIRRASGAARLVGRELLTRFGHDACALPKGPSGAPFWPPGIVGSFAHDDDIAVAAVARRRDVSAIGIDVEPAEMLPDDLQELVITAKEREQLADAPCAGRLIFAAKEAVYKAVAVLDGISPDYHDIEINLGTRQAGLTNGRSIRLRYCLSPRIVVLAFVPASRERS